MNSAYQQYLAQLSDYLIQSKDDEIAIPYTNCEWFFDPGRYCKAKYNKPAGSYENELLEFMSRDIHSFEVSQLVHVVIGGLGTGKSTTLSRCYNRYLTQELICPKGETKTDICKRNKRLIILDFERWTEHLSLEELNDPAEYRDKLWNTIASRLNKATRNTLKINEEITVFWRWCCKELDILEESSKVQRFFQEIEPKLQAVENNMDYFGIGGNDLLKELANERERFMRNLEEYDSRAFAIYCLLRLKYVLKIDGGLCSCTQIFVDNLDHVVPEGQVIVANFAQKIAGYLGVRMIIAVRPLTYERSIHAHFVDIRTYHKSPDPCVVVTDRILKFMQHHGKSLPKQLRKDLEDLRVLLSGKHVPRSAISMMLNATSGLSVRNALLSARDFIKSEILYDKRTGMLALRDRKTSDFVKALFFGPQQGVDTKKYEILYSVNGDFRISYALIKPRILDFLIRIENGQTSIRRVFDFMSCFLDDEEYEREHWKEIVRTALNELMLRYRPLIWSQDGFSVEKGTESSNGSITVTHIGRGYWDSLFGELLYEEVCLSLRTGERVTIENVVEFHKKLTERDVLEIGCCKKIIGCRGYNRYYPRDDMVSLSLYHWDGLDRSLSIRLKEDYETVPVLDRRREEWIKNMVTGRRDKIVNTVEGIIRSR